MGKFKISIYHRRSEDFSTVHACNKCLLVGKPEANFANTTHKVEYKTESVRKQINRAFRILRKIGLLKLKAPSKCMNLKFGYV
jgi:hypothetical protein